METNLPTDEPLPAPTPEPSPETTPSAAPAAEAPAPVETGDAPAAAATHPVDAPPSDTVPEEPAAQDELGQLTEASQRARLSPSDEERMGTLLKESLMGGRGGVARAIEALPKVPWIVGVRAVEAVWPELTAGFRTQLLSGLAKEETDASRRIRLSLARALFKFDVPVALKLAVGAARELRDTESGTLTSKQAQIFANVFIGRGKPWLAQISLADLKPADGDALAHCAILAVFALPHPPVTQLGVLKWAREQERLGKLNAAALEAVKKGVSRWSAKWQGALRKEVSDLPEEIASLSLKPVAEAAPEADEATPREARRARKERNCRRCRRAGSADRTTRTRRRAMTKTRTMRTTTMRTRRKAAARSTSHARKSRPRSAQSTPRAMRAAMCPGISISARRCAASMGMCNRCARN